jgi:nicotinamide-nucleotide amidase
MSAGLLIIGSELLRYRRPDTNSTYLKQQLEELGHPVGAVVTVGDHERDIAWGLRQLLARHALVVATGGLGPTRDDRTVMAVARVLRRRPVRDRTLRATIAAKLRHLPAAARRYNLNRQSRVIDGARLLPNPRGTAPGQWLRRGRRVVILLPGVPRELEAIWITAVVPRLRAGRPAAVLRLRTVGLPESEVDRRLESLSRFRGLELTTIAQRWQVDVVLRRGCGGLVEPLRAARRRLGAALFEVGDRDLSEVVGELLRARGWTVAVGESCTGGLLSHMLAAVPGASAYFLGGVVAYDNAVKRSALGVPARLLRTAGAVSVPVAAAMARGARSRLGADLGLGLTGIAGPSGGSPSKPVGLVHLALAHRAGLASASYRFRGARGEVQRQAALAALELLRRRCR